MGRNFVIIALAVAVALVSSAFWGKRQAQAAELIMFDSKSCGVCVKFNREIAPGYRKSPAARIFPLRNIDVHNGNVDFILKVRPTMTPTFVFVDRGVEIGRFVGFPGKKYFYKIVNSAAEAMAAVQASRAAKQLPEPETN